MARANPVGRRKVVTIFGSSRVHEPDSEYQDAWRLGRLLAERGWTLCNGGHDGTMEAAARGAKEAGGQTIGISFNLYRPSKPNPWLDQEFVTESLLTRLEKLVTLGEAYIVLRGGIGTLLELALVWNLVQSPEFAHKPVIVVGETWAVLFEAMRTHMPMHPWEAESLTLVDTVEDAVERLEAHFVAQQAATDSEARREAS